MLLVKTYLDRSPIHGLGVFAAEPIPKGAKIWRYVEGFDRSWTPRQFARLPREAQEFIAYYGYRVDGEILLTVDNDHFINHSDDSNTYWRSGHIRARRDIAKGEEITNSYRLFDTAFCAAFLDKKKKPAAVNGVNGHKTNGHKANGHAPAGGIAADIHLANGHGATGGKDNAAMARAMAQRAAAVIAAKRKSAKRRSEKLKAAR
ncbi:MAG: SET domain-containing protein [Xanthobacteraceae bacterium]|jgi:hypothetical protein|uniref:SET domain-containing protein n=1 Tax=Pseudolabrys sp. TaxID=1960880 RepID=UPI003D137D71